MDCPGVLANNVDDCVSVLNAISGNKTRPIKNMYLNRKLFIGPDDCDSTTRKEPYPKVELPFLDQINVEGIRVGIPEQCSCEGLMPEVRDTWVKIADILEDNGAQVRRVSMPNMLNSIYVYSVLNQCEVASNMARYDGVEYGHRASTAASTEELYAKSRSEGFNTVVKTRILAGNYFLLKRNYDNYYIRAMKVRRMIFNDFKQVFEKDGIDVLLTPTTLTDAPLYREFVTKSNRDQCALNDLFTTPANLAGIPAVSIPIRLSSNCLPISLQLMGNTLQENLLLRVAKWIESRVDFQGVAPPEDLRRMMEIMISVAEKKTS